MFVYHVCSKILELNKSVLIISCIFKGPIAVRLAKLAINQGMEVNTVCLCLTIICLINYGSTADSIGTVILNRLFSVLYKHCPSSFWTKFNNDKLSTIVLGDASGIGLHVSIATCYFIYGLHK